MSGRTSPPCRGHDGNSKQDADSETATTQASPGEKKETRTRTIKNPNSTIPNSVLDTTIETAFTTNTTPIAPTPTIYNTAIAWLVIRNAWKSSLITRGHSSAGPCVISVGQDAVGSKEPRIVRFEHDVMLCGASMKLSSVETEPRGGEEGRRVPWQ